MITVLSQGDSLLVVSLHCEWVIIDEILVISLPSHTLIKVATQFIIDHHQLAFDVLLILFVFMQLLRHLNRCQLQFLNFSFHFFTKLF